MREYIRLFKALADGTRLRILKLICESGQKTCVCELADALDLPSYQVSKHLAVLRQSGLVVDDRSGTWVSYEPSGEPTMLRELYEFLRRQVRGPQFDRDLKRLRIRLALRQEGQCVLGPGHPLAAAAYDRAGLAGVRTAATGDVDDVMEKEESQ